MSDERRARERATAGGEGADDSAGDATWQAQVADAPEFLVLLDEDLTIRFVNHTQPGIGDGVGKPATAFLPPEAHGAIRRAVTAATRSGKPQHYTVPGTGPNGEMSWYSSWIVPVDRRHAGAPLVLITSDVTHRRRVEEQLQDERSVLRSLVEHAPDYILILDRQHRIRFMNRPDRGMSDAMVLGQLAEDFLPEAQRDLARSAIESVFETGQSQALDAEIKAPEGSFWVSARVGPVFRDGRVDRVSMVCTDITERKLLEQTRAVEQDALRQSEARFRTLVDSAPEVVVIFDVETQRFVDCNEKACAFFELSRDEIYKHGPLDLSAPMTPDGRPSAEVGAEVVARAIRGEPQTFEWTHRTGGGRDIPCEVRLVLLPHPERIQIRGSMTDISDRLAAENERTRLNDELFQARKMQAIGQLTGGVAHDFNNLLTVIMAHTELLQHEADRPEQVMQHAGQVMEASQRAALLTQQLLAFARRQPLRPRVVDLGTLVSHVEGLLRRTLGETIEVRSVSTNDLWPCEVDPTQLENALLNLAINARDAMPDGGTLTIETRNVELPTRCADGAPEVRQPHVLLLVGDTGVGMTGEVQAQAFEPFFTTKEVGTGSGLGLSMVYGFVQQSGGQVRISSTEGVGTEVAIYLPRSEAMAKSVDQPASREAVLRGTGELVLVVEDDPQVRALTVETLQRLGYRTQDAQDAASALRMLPEMPDVALLITDVVLPGGVSGPELARRAATMRPAMPVVFMSGYPEDALTQDGRLGTDMILLQKPFTQREIAAAVRAGLAASARA